MVDFLARLPMVSFGAVYVGVIWGVMAIGVYLTFRVLDFADLTVDGTIPLGAAVSGVCIVMGANPAVSLLVAFLAGTIAGLITALLHTKLGIHPILAGILTQISFDTAINLHIMGIPYGWSSMRNGQANISLLNERTVFSDMLSFFKLDPNNMIAKNAVGIFIGVIALAIIIALVRWFLCTQKGFAMRATGINPKMARAMGINTDNMIILGLMISNGIIALGGALAGQMNGFADSGLGKGSIVVGLAAVIIGEVIFGKRSLLQHIIAVALGSVVYRWIYSFVMLTGLLPPIDAKLLTAIMVALALAMPVIREKTARKKTE